MTEISNALVALHREHFGRGPGAAKCALQGDVLVSTMTDVFTPVERTLIEAGKHEDVKRTRQSFQTTMRDRFSEAIEEVTQRKVIQFMSQVSFDPDMAAEIFVLEPIGGDHGS
jgi:uncharacterized protein YbcI